MNTNFLTNRLRAAAKSALDNVAKISGQNNDPNLRIYGLLQPEDFNEIVKKFGPDRTTDYIQAMETKKMTGGKHA